MVNPVKYLVYWAGDLFDHKHIAGNFLLAKEVEKLSGEKCRCLLPQNWEGNKAYENSIAIRNRDIKSVIQADFVLFNFDGTDLDSGTIVEFMVAKMLDIPVVLLRTDMRNGGYQFSEDWNLMVNGFPRCHIVKQVAIELYNQSDVATMHEGLAISIIDAFEKVRQEQTLFRSAEELFAAYQHVVTMCGAGLGQLVTNADLQKIIGMKREKNIYPLSFFDMHNEDYFRQL